MMRSAVAMKGSSDDGCVIEILVGLHTAVHKVELPRKLGILEKGRALSRPQHFRDPFKNTPID